MGTFLDRTQPYYEMIAGRHSRVRLWAWNRALECTQTNKYALLESREHVLVRTNLAPRRLHNRKLRTHLLLHRVFQELVGLRPAHVAAVHRLDPARCLRLGGKLLEQVVDTSVGIAPTHGAASVRLQDRRRARGSFLGGFAQN